MVGEDPLGQAFEAYGLPGANRARGEIDDVVEDVVREVLGGMLEDLDHAGFS